MVWFCYLVLFGLVVNGLRYLSVWFGLVYLIYRIGSVRMSFKWVVHVHTHHSNFQLLDEDPTIVLHLQPLDRSSQQASSPLHACSKHRPQWRDAGGRRELRRRPCFSCEREHGLLLREPAIATTGLEVGTQISRWPTKPVALTR